MQNERICTMAECDRPVKCKGLCHRHYQRKLRQNHPEWTIKYCEQQRLRILGVTPDMFNLQFKKQHKRCAICKLKTHNGKGWHADHDNVSGKFRGVLCSRCNTGLGMFLDDVELMQTAIQYIEQNKQVKVL